jgi:hypothetical protein
LHPRDGTLTLIVALTAECAGGTAVFARRNVMSTLRIRLAMPALLLALPSCSDAVSTQLQKDEAAYAQAAAKLAADKEAGRTVGLSADAETYKLALEQLRYDRGSNPDENGGHGASGGSGHARHP